MGDEKGFESQIEKYKARGWRICKCGTGWVFCGIIFFIIGVVFLAYYGKYWGDDEEWERGLAYAGVALLLLGILVFAIGVFFCVILCCIYKKINGPQRTAYKSPTFPPGEAPYPQQPPYQPVATTDSPQHVPQGQPGAQPHDIHVQVSENTPF